MTNPYKSKKPTNFWYKSVSGRGPTEVDPVIDVPFHIFKDDLIATAGSCFAQHIAHYLKDNEFQYFVTEDHPVIIGSEDENYGTFSARYGNIYTVRQLWQLFQRAYGLFEPLEDAWCRADGRFIDPFRPRIQSAGFISVEELRNDRELHLAAVRRLFENCDVFIFTFGLTEGWISIVDGAVFPLAPGTVVENLDDEDYLFKNFTVSEMETDMNLFIEGLRTVNPQCRVLTTVSPVALVATYENSHVLPATFYSKSALRVVAETVRLSHHMNGYFPSYEIITGPQARGSFFEDDLREVKPEGVSHVMSIFSLHYLSKSERAPTAPTTTPTHVKSFRNAADAVSELKHVICDEEQILVGL